MHFSSYSTIYSAISRSLRRFTRPTDSPHNPRRRQTSTKQLAFHRNGPYHPTTRPGRERFMPHPTRMTPDESAVLVVDVQEKLMVKIPAAERWCGTSAS